MDPGRLHVQPGQGQGKARLDQGVDGGGWGVFGWVGVWRQQLQPM